jgi:hypothetical protein
MLPDLGPCPEPWDLVFLAIFFGGEEGTATLSPCSPSSPDGDRSFLRVRVAKTYRSDQGPRACVFLRRRTCGPGAYQLWRISPAQSPPGRACAPLPPSQVPGLRGDMPNGGEEIRRF